MMDKNVEMYSVSEPAPWITLDADIAPGTSIPTSHLSDEVVETAFRLGIDSRTVVGESRRGGYWFYLNFGERMNPKDLTNQEKEYIIEMLKYSIENLEYSKEYESESETE